MEERILNMVVSLMSLVGSFVQEGRRRQDMIRFGIFTTKAWFSHDKSDETKNLYPIPNKVLLTNSNLKQNPGYSK